MTQVCNTIVYLISTAIYRANEGFTGGNHQQEVDVGHFDGTFRVFKDCYPILSIWFLVPVWGNSIGRLSMNIDGLKRLR